MLGDCANCNCARMCAVKGKSCVPVEESEMLARYTPEERRIMEAAAYVEATYYMQYTRLQELAAFAERMRYKTLGLAFCIGIAEEARLFVKYLSRLFTVYSVCCKNCGISKEKLGLKRVRPEAAAESMCNPKGQAQYLNAQGCELFVSAGLCVGHDALFSGACDGPVTTLAVKDRVLGNHPMAVVYSGYWKRKLGLTDERPGSRRQETM